MEGGDETSWTRKGGDGGQRRDELDKGRRRWRAEMRCELDLDRVGCLFLSQKNVK